MGPPLAWSLDVFERTDRDGERGDARDTLALRLFLHDAAAGADVQRRVGRGLQQLPPARLTVVIITAANFDQLPLYPDILLAHTAPQHVVLGHWEDFFRSAAAEPRVVRGIRAQDLLNRLTPFVGSQWTAPRPGSVIRFRW
jgi:hypothetical protein